MKFMLAFSVDLCRNCMRMSPMDWKTYYCSYVAIYLQRDIRDFMSFDKLRHKNNN